MIFLVFALLVAEADANSLDPSSVEARALFEEGRRQYDAEHYADARAWFERAWNKQQLPKLLFNIGQCHFQLEDYQAAIEHYQHYLALVPTAHNRALVQDVITEARTALAAQPPQPPHPPPRPPRSLDVRGVSAAVVPSSLPSDDVPDPPHFPASGDTPQQNNTWMWAGAIAGAIAVVAVGGAVAFALAPDAPTLGVIDARAP